MMDSALELRILSEKGISISSSKITEMLNKSKLVANLTDEYMNDSLFNIFRIICLAEIPCIQNLNYTKKVINYISHNIATDYGFSYTGKIDDVVPCYNAMLLEAYSRLGLYNSKEVQNALEWIKNNQSFERNIKTTWQYKGIKKHGGCLNATPCFIGIGKTIRALITYNEITNKVDNEVTKLINKGLEYMLKHQMYLRLSDNKPITKHITDNMFPQNYSLSLTDLVYIIGKCDLSSDAQTAEIMKLINDKMIAENEWKIDYKYKFRGYITFDKKTGKSDWISELYNIWLYNK